MNQDFWQGKMPSVTMTEEEFLRSKTTIVDLFETACATYGDKPVCSNFGGQLSFHELERLSRDLAAYLQNLPNLEPGDRISVQLPNLLQYHIAAFAIIRAGFILVNVNPLYSAPEMIHQFSDSGTKVLITYSSVGSKLNDVIPHTPVQHVILTNIGDLLPFAKRIIIHAVMKYVKKMIPSFKYPQAIKFKDALRAGRNLPFKKVAVKTEDTALLQYTGGTTGISKGAVLTHKNLISNVEQIEVHLADLLEDGKDTMIAPLPLYHIFAFTVVCLLMLKKGSHSVLITNPRDIKGLLAEMRKWSINYFIGVNTLFIAMLNHRDFRRLDFSKMKITVAGGMALTSRTAHLWEELTGRPILEGYGLSETSPVATFNLPGRNQIGTIGVPLVFTKVKLINDGGEDLPLGDASVQGEICIKGPQVMSQYYQTEAETKNAFTKDGWLKTGDIGIIQADGYIRIVDRKKDMIIVSGFNVYPNEVEEVLLQHEKVLECAIVGSPNTACGESVIAYIIAKDPSLTEHEIKEFCRSRLTPYKRPRIIIFRNELPKTNVGKILRRALKEEAAAFAY